MICKQVMAGSGKMLAKPRGNGLGVTRNVDEAVKWYRKAAEQGLAEAQNNLERLGQGSRSVEF